MAAEQGRKIQALEAKLCILRGQPIPKNGKADIAWYDQQFVSEYIRDCPRSFYGQLAGKQLKSLQDQAATYGIPTARGENVDIVAVLRWFNEFLAEWGPKIKRKQLANEESAQRADRKEQLELAQLELRLKSLAADLEKKTKNSIPLDEIDKVFSWYESELRRLGERLGKRFGADAQTLFNTNLDRMAKFLDDACGNQPATD